MNDITVNALNLWALFCVNHSDESTAREILPKIFNKNLAEHFLGRFLDHDCNWNEVVITMDYGNKEALFIYVFNHF